MRLPKRGIPGQLSINGETYKVKMAKTIRKDPTTVGLCDYTDKIIWIKKGQSRGETFATLVHEVLHAMSEEHALTLTHNKVYALEKAIVSFFFENF